MESMTEQVEYVIRTQSDRAYTYGLGKVVGNGVALFERGFYGLTKEELNAKMKSLGKVTIR
jgi:hypothetical protein